VTDRRAGKRVSRGRVARETDLSRHSGTRQSRDTVLIVTNGECTERQYFEALRREPWLSVALRVIVRREAPQALIVTAAALRDIGSYDHMWVVCDVDEYDVSQAVIEAPARGVGLALSQPCFEVWLILHKSDRCPGFNNASQACEQLRKLVPDWRKERLDFADFRDGIADARDRAQRRGEPPDANPSTAVWRIIDCVDGRRTQTN
jgi:hypothetical protein